MSKNYTVNVSGGELELFRLGLRLIAKQQSEFPPGVVEQSAVDYEKLRILRDSAERALDYAQELPQDYDVTRSFWDGLEYKLQHKGVTTVIVEADDDKEKQEIIDGKIITYEAWPFTNYNAEDIQAAYVVPSRKEADVVEGLNKLKLVMDGGYYQDSDGGSAFIGIELSLRNW